VTYPAEASAQLVTRPLKPGETRPSHYGATSAGVDAERGAGALESSSSGP
jgi:hypothetical protein